MRNKPVKCELLQRVNKPGTVELSLQKNFSYHLSIKLIVWGIICIKDYKFRDIPFGACSWDRKCGEVQGHETVKPSQLILRSNVA